MILPTRQTLVGRAIRLPLRLIPRATVVKVRAGLTKGMKWRVGSGVHGYWLGTCESKKQQFTRNLVRPGKRVFDIGANGSFYTLAFSALGAHVWAFEPLGENIASLLHHVRINALRNVTVIQTAVSDRSGVAGFAIAESLAMGGLSDSANEYLVPTVSLDGLVAAGLIPKPEVVKMDVEGASRLC